MFFYHAIELTSSKVNRQFFVVIKLPECFFVMTIPCKFDYIYIFFYRYTVVYDAFSVMLN